MLLLVWCQWVQIACCWVMKVWCQWVHTECCLLMKVFELKGIGNVQHTKFNYAIKVMCTLIIHYKSTSQTPENEDGDTDNGDEGITIAVSG